MFDDPILKLYALVSTLVALHLVLLALWTGVVRTRHKTFVNPEDAATLKGTNVESDHPDVLRVKRAHQNAMENALPFFAIGLVYALSKPSMTGAYAYFFTFLGARVLHSLFYLWGKQPFRTLMFGVGVAAVVGMGVRVIRHAM
jgi:glutathione S-transferase